MSSKHLPSNTKKEDSYIEPQHFGAETRERIIRSIDRIRPLNLQGTIKIMKKKRRVIRAQATRTINEANHIVAKQQAPDIIAVSGLIERLLLVQKQLSDVNATIELHIIDDDADAEFERVLEYDDKIASCLGSMKTFGKSEAEGAIAGLQATAECYAHAIEILAQRFGNPTALIRDHMQGLIDLRPVISARNVRELRRLFDDL
ncbi:hypothetical protein HPB50_009075 [Hyalomma asiaticum]|uniref:Uncharacterized protein n=1 Tax=Hyalomma asiaticum TaxID=266040 RepID=A0ACB7T439_HYAAI|nr:hypothetical protein HPB50_009075 [Hyalomma asiaticum]